MLFKNNLKKTLDFMCFFIFYELTVFHFQTVICYRELFFCIDAQSIKKLKEDFLITALVIKLYLLSRKFRWISVHTFIVTGVQPPNSVWKEAYD